jgi:hypothetical protein
VPNFHHEILFLWGCIEDGVCHNNTRNLDELEANMSNISVEISAVALPAVSTDTLHRARLRMQPAGAHSQCFM